MVAVVAGKALGIQTSPPLHVDALWHLQILNTELYRNLALDKLVLSTYNRVATETHLIAETSLTNIDHSTFDFKGRGERLKKTVALYKLIGFDPAHLEHGGRLLEGEGSVEGILKEKAPAVEGKTRIFVKVKTLTGKVITIVSI